MATSNYQGATNAAFNFTVSFTARALINFAMVPNFGGGSIICLGYATFNPTVQNSLCVGNNGDVGVSGAGVIADESGGPGSWSVACANTNRTSNTITFTPAGGASATIHGTLVIGDVLGT
jgi:hypothetical protein